jgi:hypothetical protein
VSDSDNRMIDRSWATPLPGAMQRARGAVAAYLD